MKKIVTTLLVLSLSGFPGLASLVLAKPTDQDVPILRHHSPGLLYQGKTMVIEAVVENEGGLSTVILWYRAKGKSRFQKINMTPTERERYEGHIEADGKFKDGIEYYIEAVNLLGIKGRDGSSGKPYFVEVHEPLSLTAPLALRTAQKEVKGRKPFWKKTWFWITVVAAIGGGIAVAGNDSGGGQASGTVIVE